MSQHNINWELAIFYFLVGSFELSPSKFFWRSFSYMWFLAFQITQHKWAWPFLDPVDVEGLGLHDYYEVMFCISKFFSWSILSSKPCLLGILYTSFLLLFLKEKKNQKVFPPPSPQTAEEKKKKGNEFFVFLFFFLICVKVICLFCTPRLLKSPWISVQ